jgi:hypothetical protein
MKITDILKRKIVVPSEKTQEIETYDMWVVSWWRRWGEYSGNETKCYQSFFSEIDAKLFKNSLDAANKLIGNTCHTTVNIERQSNALQ